MPVAQKPRRKFRPKQRTYVLDQYLDGEMKGAHIVMGSMTAREFIRLQSGELGESGALEFTASKVVEHDIDVDDIRDLDAEDFLAIGVAWNRAVKDKAVPPVPGDS